MFVMQVIPVTTVKSVSAGIELHVQRLVSQNREAQDNSVLELHDKFQAEKEELLNACQISDEHFW